MTQNLKLTYFDSQFLNIFVKNGKSMNTIEGTNIKEMTSVFIYIGKFSKGFPKRKNRIFIDG
ncbi:MAG: hypothetical protein ACK5F6_03160 [Bacteroidota bacterium]|jgi:hypothetical protein